MTDAQRAAHPLCDVLNVVPSWIMRDSQDTSVPRTVAGTHGAAVNGTYKCTCGNQIHAIEVTLILNGSKCSVTLPQMVRCTCSPWGPEMRYYE